MKELNSLGAQYYSFSYDDKDRVVKVTWGGGEMGHSETYYKYEDNLLVEIYYTSRSDTMQGCDYTIKFEYLKKK